MTDFGLAFLLPRVLAAVASLAALVLHCRDVIIIVGHGLLLALERGRLRRGGRQEVVTRY